jgi:flagellar hook-basal body complex protein FliE
MTMSSPLTFRPTPIVGIDERVGTTAPAAPAGAQNVDFGSALTGAMAKAGAEERAADDAAQRFAAGDPSMGIHEVMIAAEKASITTRYAVTLKNKVLEAYRELMNTPL